jgi:hypothetical protein
MSQSQLLVCACIHQQVTPSFRRITFVPPDTFPHKGRFVSTKASRLLQRVLPSQHPLFLVRKPVHHVSKAQRKLLQEFCKAPQTFNQMASFSEHRVCNNMSMHTLTRARTHTHTYIHTHKCTYIHTHKCTCIHTYIHTYNAYMHTCIHTYMQCIHAYIHIYTHTYIIHTYIHKYIHTYVHTCIRTYIHTCIHTHAARSTRHPKHMG